MNLFGLSIGLARNGTNNKYVKKDECHAAQDRIKASIDDLERNMNLQFLTLNNRITDLMSKR